MSFKDLPERDVSLGEWFPPIRGVLLSSSVKSGSHEDEGTTNIKTSATTPPKKKQRHIPEDFDHLKPTGYVMHHQFNIQQLYALPTLYLCVLYLSENKQRLVPLTA